MARCSIRCNSGHLSPRVTNSHLGSRSSQQEGTHHVFHGKPLRLVRPMTLLGEPPTAMFIKQHNSYLHSKYVSFHPQISVTLVLHQRSRDQYRNSQLVKLYRTNDQPHLIQPQYNPYNQRLRKQQKREEKDCRSERTRALTGS